MKLPSWVWGEIVGTFFLVFFGCGSVCAAVLTGAQVGIFQVAIVWGIGIAIAIHLTGSISGAHLNPAVTLGMAVWRRFPIRRVGPYWGCQLLGAFVAAALLYAVYASAISTFEKKNNIVRGEPGSEASAMIFGEYYPNPGGKPFESKTGDVVSQGRAMLVEITGTAILLIVIFAVTDERNSGRPQILTATIIGLTITVLISLFGPLTMACFNPARDFGPRVLSSLMGWRGIPFSANGAGWFTVYIAAPLIGAVLGGAIYEVALRPGYVGKPEGDS